MTSLSEQQACIDHIVNEITRDIEFSTKNLPADCPISLYSNQLGENDIQVFVEVVSRVSSQILDGFVCVLGDCALQTANSLVSGNRQSWPLRASLYRFPQFLKAKRNQGQGSKVVTGVADDLFDQAIFDL